MVSLMLQGVMNDESRFLGVIMELLKQLGQRIQWVCTIAWDGYGCCILAIGS
jgi:hypothetical protein